MTEYRVEQNFDLKDMHTEEYRDEAIYVSFKVAGSFAYGALSPEEAVTFADDLIEAARQYNADQKENESVNPIEQFKSFPIGTTFVTDADPEGELGYWVKLDKTRASYVNGNRGPATTVEFKFDTYNTLYPKGISA